MRLTGKSLLLLLLFAPTVEGDHSPILGRTRLMKMVFLFEKELLESFRKDRNIDELNLPEFFPWHYGPFSSKLLDDLEFLINRGFVISDERGNPVAAELEEYAYWVEDFDDGMEAEYTQEAFSLSDSKGIDRTQQLWEDLTENQRRLLAAFKEQLNQASLDRILEYVYKKYAVDGYVEESLIRDRYLG